MDATYQEFAPFRLNRLATWHALDENRLQLRMPDGDHITFDRDGPAIAEALSALQVGVAPARGSIGESLAAMLAERRMLADRRVSQSNKALGGQPTGQDDWMIDALDYVLGFGDAPGVASPVARARSVIIDIRGEGWLADEARAAAGLAELRLHHNADDDQAETPGLIVAVADLVRYDWFSAQNSAAASARTPILFLWREMARIVAGPLVIPGESACFECYRTRVRSNLQFTSEFDAFARWTLDDQSLPGSRLASAMVRALIARQLLLVAAGAYDLVEPGTIYSFDLLTLESARQPILRVVRCPGCAGTADAPRRAVRAIA